MRKRLVRLIGYFILLLGFFLFVSFSVKSLQAQEEVQIPGPEIKDASFIKIKDLKIGDWVFIKNEVGNLIPEQITKLEYKEEPVEVYNLSVEGKETFFANDFAVHNKVPDRDPVCYIYLSPRVFTAASRGYTETWSIGHTGSWGGHFKSLFQYTGIGPNGGGFAKNDGNQICRFGQVINGCLYPKRDVASAECRSCRNSCGNDCNCSVGVCASVCEMTCGPYKYGYTASDRLRFREHNDICDGNGCGSAIKVTAPEGYVIKSMTYSSQINMCNRGGCVGNILLSRGMRWHLDDGMRPNAVFATLSRSGRHTVQMDRATKYFFIYSEITERDEVGNDLNDNRAEIWDIELEMIKTTEIHETQVEVVNNSLIWYDISHKVGEWHFRAVDDGTISFSNDNGQTWSSPQNIPDGNGNFTYAWTLDSSNPTVLAKVTRSGGVNPSYCSASIGYSPPTGTITGTVYEGTSCPLGGSGISGGTVTITGQTPQTANPSYSYTVPSGSSYTVSLVTPPPDYQSANVYCEGSTPKQVVNLGADETRVIDVGVTREVNPWFQTWEGDVHSNGSISSEIPSTATNPYFSLHDADETSGVISYNGAGASFGEGEISPEDDWLAKDYFSKLSFDFDYFYKLVGSPDPSTFPGNGKLPSESGVYYYDVPLTLGKETVPDDKKLVILVDGAVTLTDGINVVPGGSLVLISSGNINVSGSVGQIEGIYITDDTFSTGDQDTQLTAEGVFIAHEFALQRGSPADPLNNTTPYEEFYYRPDLVINSSSEIWTAAYSWQEIPP